MDKVTVLMFENDLCDVLWQVLDVLYHGPHYVFASVCEYIGASAVQIPVYWLRRYECIINSYLHDGRKQDFARQKIMTADYRVSQEIQRRWQEETKHERTDKF